MFNQLVRGNFFVELKIVFLVWLRKQLISAGLEPVFNTGKSCKQTIFYEY